MVLPRRGFLGALALAPAALAGCASSAAAAPRGRLAAPPRSPAAQGESNPAVAAVRAFPLRPDAEPVLVFRAAAARPGEP